MTEPFPVPSRAPGARPTGERGERRTVRRRARSREEVVGEAGGTGAGPETGRAAIGDPLADVATLPFAADFWLRFSIERQLGREGAYGRTYLVRRAGTDERYALKVLNAGDPDALKDETGALSRLSQAPACRQHVACLYGALVVPGKGQRFAYATLSEFVPGRTLGEIVERRGPVGCDAIALLRGLLEALAAVHDAGLAHRDISPDNAILSSGRGVVLIDFGLSCAARPGGADGAACAPDVVGTPGFMAPEVEDGAIASLPQDLVGPAAQAADVFSVGAVAHLLATGRVPSRRGEPVSAGLGECFDALLAAMLAGDPRARPDVHAAARWAAECDGAPPCGRSPAA